MMLKISNGKNRNGTVVYNVSRPVRGSLTTMESVGVVQCFDGLNIVTFISSSGEHQILKSRDVAGWKHEVSLFLNTIGA